MSRLFPLFAELWGSPRFQGKVFVWREIVERTEYSDYLSTIIQDFNILKFFMATHVHIVLYLGLD